MPQEQSPYPYPYPALAEGAPLASEDPDPSRSVTRQRHVVWKPADEFYREITARADGRAILARLADR